MQRFQCTNALWKNTYKIYKNNIFFLKIKKTTYLLQMLGAATFVTKQFISLATALMRKVFPHPEGPYNKMPLGNVSPVNGKKITHETSEAFSYFKSKLKFIIINEELMFIKG